MELTPEVVEDCVKASIHNHASAVIVPEFSFGEGFWTKCKALERSCCVGDETVEVARFFGREVFFGVGCFDEEITGPEDWDLHARIGKAGFKIGRINSFIKHNEGRLSLRKTMTKKRYYGKTLKLYKSKHPKEEFARLKILRPAFIRNWRKLARDPLHASGMFFMKACESSSLRIGLW
jgi:GT2 family glycosyltransferase